MQPIAQYLAEHVIQFISFYVILRTGQNLVSVFELLLFSDKEQMQFAQITESYVHACTIEVRLIFN